jgi:hypothetical protein
VARMGEDRKVYKGLMGRRPLKRPRRTWKNGIRMDFGDWLGVCGLDSTGSG